MFSDFLKLGFDHILDINGYDHILFVAVLCALYSPKEWKKIIILVTAFTIGHSLTLGLAVIDVVRIPAAIIETLIPVTIILTGIYNVFTTFQKDIVAYKVTFNYFMALGFGLIHGLGFSNYFKAILGREESILEPLFAFNLGVEGGQIVIVGLILMIGYLLIHTLRLPKKYWTLCLSALGIVVACYLLLTK